MTLSKSTTLFTLICLSTTIVLTGCQPNDTVEKTEDASQHSELDHDAPDHNEEHSEHHEDHADHGEHHEDEGHEDEDHEDEHDHDHERNYTTFNCTPDTSLSVYYHADIHPKTAHLLIDGIEYDLTQPNSLADDVHPGDVYIGSLGLDDNHGLLWQVKDNNATLYEIPVAQGKADTLQETESLQNKKPLYQCQPATAA